MGSSMQIALFVAPVLVIAGRTNWFEGVQLLAIYTILAMAFYFV